MVHFLKKYIDKRLATTNDSKHKTMLKFIKNRIKMGPRTQHKIQFSKSKVLLQLIRLLIFNRRFQ